MSDDFRAFVYGVRRFTRDHAELNRLIRGQESTDRQVAWAAVDALSAFNGTPPVTQHSLGFLLQKQQEHLLRRMTVISLLESVGLLQTRNHLNYSDGGINVAVSDKTPMIMNWLGYFKGSTDQMKMQVKIAMNIESILGDSGVFSEYWAVNSTYIGF